MRKGLVHDWDDIVAEFSDPAYDWWAKIMGPKLATMTTAEVTVATGLGERAVRNLRAGRPVPSGATLKKVKLLFRRAFVEEPDHPSGP